MSDGDPTSLLEMQRDATEPILLDEDLVDSRPLIDDPEPERKPFGERFAEWRKHYLPLPDEVVEEYLGEDEYVVHTDHPSFRAFLIQNVILVVVVSIVGPIFVYLARGGVNWTTLLLFLGLDIVLLYMAIKRLQDRYVSYVISNLRLIRLSGVFGRRLNSIPWTRMTGLGYFQGPLGRILGYATIHIESANEESGLRRFSNINDPATFHQRILDMVSSKTGQSAGGKPPPPTKGVRKSLFQRRKERREMGGPNKAAAPWPKADDPDAGKSDKPEPTDSAKAYEASIPDDDKKPSGGKQPLRPQSAGRRLGPGGGGGGGGGGGQRRPGQAPPSARRRGPAPPGPTDPYGDPSTPAPRSSGPAPGRRPGTPGSSGGPSVADGTPRSQQLRRTSGRPAAGDGRPSLIPDYGRNRPGQGGGGAPADTDAAADAEVDAVDTGFPQPRRESPPLTPPRGTARIRPGEPRTPPGGTGAVPSRGPAPTPPPPRPPQRRSTGRRPTPPAGTPAVRPGEPRGPRPPTDAAAETTDLAAEPADLGSAPGPSPEARAEPRQDTDPPASPDTFGTEQGTRDRSGSRTPPGTDAPAPEPRTGSRQDTSAGPATGAGPDADLGGAEQGVNPDASPGGPTGQRRDLRSEGRGPASGTEQGVSSRWDDSADASADAATGQRRDLGPEGRGPESSAERGVTGRAGEGADESSGGATGQDRNLRPEGRGSESGVEGGDDAAASPGTESDADAALGTDEDRDEGADAGAAPVVDVPEFAPPTPRTPPSSRRMTPPGGTSAVRPGEPRTPPPGESNEGVEAGDTDAPRSARTEPLVPPSLRRQTPPGGTSAVRPGEPRPPRRPEAGQSTGSTEPAGPTESTGSGETVGETGSGGDEPRRQPWLFGRQRPGASEPGARRRRRFSWFRREPLVDEDDGGDGDAHDALETLRPLGSARRRAQSFRRPRFRSFGRGRRPLFPPGRELPPAATDDDPDTPDDRPS